MSHCVEGCRALQNERFKSDMLDRLSSIVGKNLLRIHAWALMDNHFHLLAEPSESSLSDAMQRLLTGFACGYNRRNDRRGHVFDARFRSILVERDSYYLKLLSYIHLNPVKAGIVASVEDLSVYPWTGHSSITGACSRPWMSQDVTKDILGNCSSDWMERYQRLLASSQEMDDGTMETGNFSIGRTGLKEITGTTERGEDSSHRGMRVLGSRDFALAQYEKYREVRGLGLRSRQEQHQQMEEALVRVSSKYGLAPVMLRSGRRTKEILKARRELLGELLGIEGVTQADTATYLNITQAAVSLLRKKR